MIGYFLIPAVAYFAVGLGRNGLALEDAPVLLVWFAPNYLIYAAPQLLWAIAVALLKVSPRTSHAGYLGATAALVSFYVASHVAGYGDFWVWMWPLYWAAAALLGVSCAFAAAVLKRRIGQPVESTRKSGSVPD